MRGGGRRLAWVMTCPARASAMSSTGPSTVQATGASCTRRRGLRGGRGRMSRSSAASTPASRLPPETTAHLGCWHNAAPAARASAPARPGDQSRAGSPAPAAPGFLRSSASRTMTMSSSSGCSTVRVSWLVSGDAHAVGQGGHRLTRAGIRGRARAIASTPSTCAPTSFTPCDTSASALTPAASPPVAADRHQHHVGHQRRHLQPTVPWPAITPGRRTRAAAGSRAALPARRRTPSPRRSCRRRRTVAPQSRDAGDLVSGAVRGESP